MSEDRIEALEAEMASVQARLDTAEQIIIQRGRQVDQMIGVIGQMTANMALVSANLQVLAGVPRSVQ